MTTEQRVKLQIGELVVANAALQAQVEELQAKLAEKPPETPKTE